MIKLYENHHTQRRRFLQSLVAIPFIANTTTAAPVRNPGDRDQSRLKVSLNAYSFNEPLSSGKMNIADMLEFCAEKGFYGVDITAYYFPGYPNVPGDEFLYDIKRTAFRLGVEISGTGVRNDFTEPDPLKRRESVELVKNWINAAEKLGAPVIRIFSGNQSPQGFTRDQVFAWMVKDIEECITYGKQHGVIVAVQNHNDFIKTSSDVVQLMQAIKSEWFGLILDTGSFRSGDPYEAIAKTIGYAVNWQIKEKIFMDGKEIDVDMDRLIHIIRASGYRGYLPLETLGEGDPKIKIPVLLEKLNKSLANA